MGARTGRRPAGGRRRGSTDKGRGQGLGDRASPLEALGVCVWEIERLRRRSSGGRWVRVGVWAGGGGVRREWEAVEGARGEIDRWGSG